MSRLLAKDRPGLCGVWGEKEVIPRSHSFFGAHMLLLLCAPAFEAKSMIERR